jgi:phosphoribosylaminoimidazole carboxylase (NCAIR synthetase)
MGPRLSEPGSGVVAGVLRKAGMVVDVAHCTPQEALQLVYAERPDGVTSYFDSDLHQQAWLAEALQLPASPSVRAATLFTDKLLQREALDVAGVPVPRFSEVRASADAAEVERLCQALSFPMLLKPRGSPVATFLRYPTPRNCVGCWQSWNILDG